MKLATWGLLAFVVSLSARAELPDDAFWFTAKASTEAVIDFTATVELASRGTPSSEIVLLAIESQVQHLFGSMAAADHPAVPKTDHRITGVKVAAKAGEPGLYTASYRYVGTGVVHNGPRTRYDILLPVRPGTVYQDALGKKGGRWFNLCTDPHYQEESDFFYFWNPTQRGCPLKEGVHYTRIQSALERIPNTRLTYPQYDRLVENGRIRIDLLFGMDDPANAVDFRSSSDESAKTARAVRKALLAEGYSERILTSPEVTQLLGKRVSPNPFIAGYRKDGRRAGIDIRLSFGPSGFDEKSHGFHLLLRDALARGSIVLYDGHSGLGGHLDLEAIERKRGFAIRPNPSRYQIYYFNACSSYPYYLRDFFGRKRTASDPKGTKNLDILTNGLQASFDSGPQTDLALIRAVDRWAAGGSAVSYQRLAALIETDALFGVNGDEDNPTSAP